MCLQEGGGIFFKTPVFGGGSVTISNCSFVSNIATTGSGGGIYFWDQSSEKSEVTEESALRIDGSKFVRNTALGTRTGSKGAGVCARSEGGPFALSISSSHFVQNVAMSVKPKYSSISRWSSRGGALYAAHAQLSVSSCSFSDNEAVP